ncbi:MAG: hypothetical protein IT377_08335 [Polyangiaceae bacterium]|nr:hypothetical protein [Polyangiaceae bacterium]
MDANRWAVLGAVWVVLGCSGSPPDDTPPSVPAPAHAPAQPGAERDLSSRAGTLVSAFSASARSSTCVTLIDGDVVAIDEHRCAPVDVTAACHDDCEAWYFCGGCLLRLDKRSSGPWLLEGRPRSSECTAFAGSYELGEAGASCTAPPPAAPPHPGQGRLIEAARPSARSSVCVGFDSSGSVEQIDEVACSVATMMHECAPGDCPWLWCGSCLMHVARQDDGKLILAARISAGACEAFAGDYEVDPGSVCE